MLGEKDYKSLFNYYGNMTEIYGNIEKGLMFDGKDGSIKSEQPKYYRNLTNQITKQ